jgi:hypothetical protein
VVAAFRVFFAGLTVVAIVVQPAGLAGKGTLDVDTAIRVEAA